MVRRVEVAVPLPIFQTYTYSVPEERKMRVQPGVRVLVPFANRKLIGLVHGLDPPIPDVELKPVLDVLDQEPLVSAELLELGRWLAAYYFAPPGEVARLLLPPGLLLRDADETPPARYWPVRKQRAVVSVSPEEPPKLGPKQALVHEWLLLRKERLPITVTDLARTAEVSAGVIEALGDKGVVRIRNITLQRSPWEAFGTAHQHREVIRHSLNSEQKRALDGIASLLERGSGSLLLHGVTGSGKTEIYLNAIERTLAEGRSALVLVPEIGLTPQISHIFRGWFDSKVAILHSALSEGERFDQWRRIRDGKASVVVGTRSAVFAPMRRLGIIIVDEEHDTSYKQEETPRYHARETVLRRAEIEGAVVVLGSATPQLETYYRATEAEAHVFQRLECRVAERPLPSVHIVDMRYEFQLRGRAAVLSNVLQEALESRLAQKEQTLILLNRRGYAPVLLCRSCGASETCENCSITLTYHHDISRLVCHYCGYGRSVPSECRKCGKEYIYYVGIGTEKLEEILRGMFPQAAIDRLDRDTAARKGAYDRILGSFSRGETDILIGTQMIAKGHDFPNVTLVGVLAADQSLRLADFRAAERTFQLVTQVAGRAGRGDQPGEVVIQTYYPNHYGLKYASAQNYEAFYAKELEFRRRFRYPPFNILANLVFRDRDADAVHELAERTAEILREARDAASSSRRMRILGPAPAALERLRGEYRRQILIKTVSRRDLQATLQKMIERLDALKINTKRMVIDIDPMSLL